MFNRARCELAVHSRMHQTKKQQCPNPSLPYQLSSKHRLLSALELAAAFSILQISNLRLMLSKISNRYRRLFLGYAVPGSQDSRGQLLVEDRYPARLDFGNQAPIARVHEEIFPRTAISELVLGAILFRYHRQDQGIADNDGTMFDPCDCGGPI